MESNRSSARPRRHDRRRVRKTGKPALLATMAMEDVSRAYEKGETKGFMKILVDRDSKQILGASLLGRR